METNTVKETISKLGEVVKKIILEAEEIIKEGRRRAKEKLEKEKSDNLH